MKNWKKTLLMMLLMAGGFSFLQSCTNEDPLPAVEARIDKAVPLLMK